MEEKKWEEKKVSLGGAIVVSVVLTVVGVIVGANFEKWFSGYAPFFGFSGGSSSVDWSPLDEVYYKLNTSYNGEVPVDEMIEGAKKGMVEALGDVYTVYMEMLALGLGLRWVFEMGMLGCLELCQIIQQKRRGF